MANVSKKEFEALKDSINAWVAATSSLFDCHKNRAAALEARLAAAEKAGDKSIADLSARVDGIEKAVTDRLIDKRCDEMSNGALAFCVDSLEARVAALSSRLDALARVVGGLSEKSHAHTMTSGDTFDVTVTTTWVDHKAGPVAPEKPTPPKPKCPWCGGEAVFDNNGLLSTRYRCTNTACLKVFWV